MPRYIFRLGGKAGLIPSRTVAVSLCYFSLQSTAIPILEVSSMSRSRPVPKQDVARQQRQPISSSAGTPSSSEFPTGMQEEAQRHRSLLMPRASFDASSAAFTTSSMPDNPSLTYLLAEGSRYLARQQREQEQQQHRQDEDNANEYNAPEPSFNRSTIPQETLEKIRSAAIRLMLTFDDEDAMEPFFEPPRNHQDDPTAHQCTTLIHISNSTAIAQEEDINHDETMLWSPQTQHFVHLHDDDDQGGEEDGEDDYSLRYHYGRFRHHPDQPQSDESD